MIAGGAYVLRRHGNSPYQRIRTLTVVSVQVLFAFLLPIVLQVFGRKEYYFSYFWPLKIEYFYPSVILQHPFLIVLWSFVGSLVAFPLLAYFFGKRFYCSWICGCGGLANTFGEPWRHLSDKSARAWTIEKVSIYSVLAVARRGDGDRLGQLGAGAGPPGLRARRVPGPGMVRVRDRRDVRRRLRRRALPAHGHARLVPLRLPDGGAARPRPEARPLPDHREEGHVHLVRQLLDLLRDGHRRAALCDGQRVLHARLLRRLRHVRPRLPARGVEAREQEGGRERRRGSRSGSTRPRRRPGRAQ